MSDQPDTMGQATTEPIEKGGFSKPIGVTGVYIPSGYVFDEFLHELQDVKGRKVYREMADNDAIIGAFLHTADSILRSAEWHVDAAEADTDKEHAEFFESCMHDMASTWSEAISCIHTQLTFGWSFLEKVYKRRVGPYERNPARRSKHTDGLIGIADLSHRSQETLQRWDVDEQDVPIGFIQQTLRGEILNIPLERGLLFRTKTHKGNPEGRSMLRNAYTSYYYKKNIQTVEAIGIERDLAGLPIVRVPSSVLTGTDAASRATLAAYTKLARDIKFNSQGGVIVPSDLWTDSTGKPTGDRKVDVELISSSGTKSIDTSAVIGRYERNILMSVLCEFLMLGTNGGSYSLSKNKTDLFLRSLKCLNDGIAAVINADLVPELWALNGFPPETMPTLRAGNVAPEDLEALGAYLSALSGAGVLIGGDPETENYLRKLANLPEISEEDLLSLRPTIEPTQQPQNPQTAEQ